MFREILEARPSAERPWKGKLSLWVGNELLYWDRRERQLVLRSASTDGSEKAVFKVMETIPGNKGADKPLEKLLADRLVFIRSHFLSNDNNDLHVERGDTRQWLIQLGADATRSLFVFSFRPAGITGPWAPKHMPPHGFKFGDDMNLYCHSLGLGLYSSFDKAPTHASPAVFGRTFTRVHDALASDSPSISAGSGPIDIAAPDINIVPQYASATISSESSDSDSVHFPVPPEALPAEVKRLMTNYDAVYMGPEDQAAFEKMGFISTREFTPGPNMEYDRPRSLILQSEVGVGVPIGGASLSWSRKAESAESWTRVDGKKYRVDYKTLQKVPALKNAPLEWDGCRTELLQSAGYPHICNENPTTFRVMFE